jgi:hypothetical protein
MTTSYHNSKELKQLKELFQDTYDQDTLLSLLEEVKGDLQLAIDRISDGLVETWGQVKGKQPKAKTGIL